MFPLPHNIKVPVLFVNGSNDPGVPLRYAEKANNVVKNSKLYIMKGCKHWAQKERPEEFVNALTKYIEECTAN